VNKPFHLSVVVTARNDNHGGSFLYRMQHFVDGFIEQCKRHKLKAELIVVDWNPPEENPPLYQALHFPKDKGPCSIRFIRVPNDVHGKLKHAEKLPLFQMIGKNVGIQRALGEFVLSTNIDIIFSDKVIRYIKRNLKPNYLYRVDRLDVPSELPKGATLPQILRFCSKSFFRVNGKYGTKIINREPRIAYYCKVIDRKCKIVLDFFRNNLNAFSFYVRNKFRCIRRITIQKVIRRVRRITIQKVIRRVRRLTIQKVIRRVQETIQKVIRRVQETIQKVIRLFRYLNNKIVLMTRCKLHTNGCGDFTLLSYNDWVNLKGYPEWEMHSWHLDSVLLYRAKQMGIKEIDLPKSMRIYHIEHGVGSGYTPEGFHLLFNRLDTIGLPYLKNSEIEEIGCLALRPNHDIYTNTDQWGMSNIEFETIWI